jgi:hypothetical protein
MTKACPASRGLRVKSQRDQVVAPVTAEALHVGAPGLLRDRGLAAEGGEGDQRPIISRETIHRSLPKFPMLLPLVGRHVEIRSAIDVPTREVPDRRIIRRNRHGAIHGGVKGGVSVPLIEEQGCVGIWATPRAVVAVLAVRTLCGEFLIRVQVATPDLFERPREVQGNTFQLFAHLVSLLTNVFVVCIAPRSWCGRLIVGRQSNEYRFPVATQGRPGLTPHFGQSP